MKLFLILFAIAVASQLQAQETVYRSALSAEALGIGAYFTVQYDYVFKQSATGFYDVRAGVGGGIFSSNESYLFFPFAATYDFGKHNHFIEAGFGGNYGIEYKPSYNPSGRFYTGPILGYRSISPKGFQFRIYANVFFYKSDVLLLGGVGVGKAFRKR